MDIIAEIREGLKRPGKSKIGLAAALGRQPSVVTAILGEGKNGKPRQVKADEVEKIRAYFRDDGRASSVIRPEGPEASEAHAADEAPRFSEFGDFDVEVRGITVGGEDDEFYFNGRVTEHVRRPPGLKHKKGVFALEVSNDSMVPRYDPGDLVYAQETNVVAGDHVVVELYHPDDETQAGKSFVKKFVRRTGLRIYCTQYNPPKEVEFDTGEVKAVYRVFPNRELFG